MVFSRILTKWYLSESVGWFLELYRVVPILLVTMLPIVAGGRELFPAVAYQSGVLPCLLILS